MAHKELKYDAEARAVLQAGVDAVANAVKVTLGPKGRYVVLDKKFGAPTITNDGAGDGTTTATLLAQTIVRHGLKNVAAGANPLALRRGIETAVEQVTEHLRAKQSKEVGGKEQVA